VSDDRARDVEAVTRRAPGRVNLIGEHTDYSEGWVMPIAIDLGVTATASARKDGCLTFISSSRTSDADWVRYPRAVVNVLRRAGIDLPGADVVIDSDLPEGAGLSSSAALELAVALALLGLAGTRVDPLRLALLCRDAEELATGVRPGPMDQIASALGRREHAMLIDVRTLEIDPLPLPLDAEGLALVVVDTGEKHRLAETAYETRRHESEEAARILGVPALRSVTSAVVERSQGILGERLFRRARHVTTENERVLAASSALRDGALPELGPLLLASHASLRDDYAVSTVALDAAVTASVEAGALGARMTGAGFGGSVLALVPADLVPAVRERVAADDVLAALGAQVSIVRPSDGACMTRSGAKTWSPNV
jgi:galactokinase